MLIQRQHPLPQRHSERSDASPREALGTAGAASRTPATQHAEHNAAPVGPGTEARARQSRQRPIPAYNERCHSERSGCAAPPRNLLRDGRQPSNLGTRPARDSSAPIRLGLRPRSGQALRRMCASPARNDSVSCVRGSDVDAAASPPGTGPRATGMTLSPARCGPIDAGVTRSLPSHEEAVIPSRARSARVEESPGEAAAEGRIVRSTRRPMRQQAAERFARGLPSTPGLAPLRSGQALDKLGVTVKWDALILSDCVGAARSFPRRWGVAR
jgi:hypothetical protein